MSIVKMKTDNLGFDFDVRLEGNDLDTVNQMTDYLQSGGQLPPIVVNQNYRVVEGRQRLEAAKRAGVDEISVTVKNFSNENEERIFAMDSQLATASPLSSESIRWNIRQLLLNGMSAPDIIVKFASRLTYPLAKRYVDDAQSTLNKERIAKAVHALFHGEKRSNVIRKFGVTEKQLNSAEERKKIKIKSRTAVPKSEMGNSVRTISRKIEDQRKSILLDINDGLITNKQAFDIVQHTVQLTDSLKKRAEDGLLRVQQAINLRKRTSAE